MIRAILVGITLSASAYILGAAFALVLPSPAYPYGVPLCAEADPFLTRLEEQGWQVEFFAVADRGAPAFIAIGPRGEVQIFSIAEGGWACLIFGGLRTEPPTAAPAIEQREG